MCQDGGVLLKNNKIYNAWPNIGEAPWLGFAGARKRARVQGPHYPDYCSETQVKSDCRQMEKRKTPVRIFHNCVDEVFIIMAM